MFGDVRQHIIEWNVRYPVDRWWRMKYGIPFGSKKHLKANHLDMYFDYMEDKLYEEAEKRNKNEDIYEEIDEEQRQPTIEIKGDAKVVINPTADEVDEDFENLDINQFK